MKIDEMLGLRMASLLLNARTARTPGQVVAWFGAMQAQDLASGEWSFGVRCAGATQADIHQATVDRTILRTWPMRGTVHFVPPRDAKWMLNLTGVRALAGAQKRREFLGLTEGIVDRAVAVLEAALRGGTRLTRAECVAVLIDAGVHTASEHGYHLLWYASQIGCTCIGPQDGKDQTFVLLDEWVPDPRTPTRDAALAELATRYFQSHGPTTRQDFAGWTGLTAVDAKLGIELAGDSLTTVDVEGATMILSAALRDEALSLAAICGDAGELLILPGFDEYLLGFKDRSAMLTGDHMKRVIPGNNGVFMPTIVEAGRVIGIWKREIKKSRVDIRALPFEPFTGAQSEAFRRAGDTYAAYLQLDANYLS